MTRVSQMYAEMDAAREAKHRAETIRYHTMKRNAAQASAFLWSRQLIVCDQSNRHFYEAEIERQHDLAVYHDGKLRELLKEAAE